MRRLFGLLLFALLSACGKEVAFDLYRDDRVIEVHIEMAPEDFSQLRQQTRDLFDLLLGECLAEPFEKPFTYFPATVTVQGQTLTNVGVRKKGLIGSLSEEKPGLKIDFGEFVSEQELFGRKKLTLNNSVSDPSLIRQCLSYQIFAKAGIPTPQCSFAHVTVNDEDLGIYVNLETPDKDYLRAHYQDEDGNLYEGTLSDFRTGWTGTFDPKTNEEENDKSDLEAVAQALEAPDDQLLSSLDPLVDIEQFLTFWAMEVLVNHGDGYTGNTNNFYVYHDPTTEQIQFFPWGVDATFFDFNFLGEGNPVSVFAVSALARRLYLLPETQARYIERLQELLVTTWSEQELLETVARYEELLTPYVDPLGENGYADAIDDVRSFIQGRRNTIELDLAGGPPAWNLPLRDDPCMRPSGQMSGNFLTTFGTLDDPNPFVTGTGTMTVNLNGVDLVLSQFSANSGPDPNDPSGSTIAIQGISFVDDGRIALAFFQMPRNLFQSGATLAVDLAGTIAILAFFDPETNQTTLDSLYIGSFTLNQAGLTEGAPVEVTFSGELVTFPF